MSKKFKLVMASVIMAGVLVAALAGAVFAHGPYGDADAEWCETPGGGGYCGLGAVSCEAVSELLGLSPEEIHEQREEGKSLVEIAAAQGVDEETLVEAIMATKRERIEEGVAAGTLTQERAELMLQQMEQRTYQAVNRTTYGPVDGERGFCGGQFGEGTAYHGMRPWDTQDTPRACYGEAGSGTGPGDMHHWGHRAR